MTRPSPVTGRVVAQIARGQEDLGWKGYFSNRLNYLKIGQWRPTDQTYVINRTMLLTNLTRVKLSIFILLITVSYNISIFSLGPPLKRLMASGSIFSTLNLDDISVLERRYSALKKALPPYATVGYVPINNKIYYENDILHYFVMKYALAPVLVDQKQQYEYIIGNFYRHDIDHQDYINQMGKSGFQVIYKIDDRLVLFRKIGQ